MKHEKYGPRVELNDLSFLSEYFHFSEIRLIKDLGGTYNLNLLLQTEKGLYVLRSYRPWTTQTRLSQLHQIKLLLASAKFPVNLPIADITGETVLSHNHRLMELEPFIVHDGEANNWEHNFIAFSLLGRLHAFLALQKNKIHLVDPVVSNYGTPEMLFTWIYQAQKNVQSKQDIEQQEKQQALSLYNDATQLLQPLQEQWNKTKQYLPQQLIHGDYGGGNLLFEHERPVAILDFDFMQVKERVFDVAYALYWWFDKQGDGQLAKVNLWHKVKELFACYNGSTQMPLTYEERQALPLEMARVPLYWIAETHFFANPAQEVIQHANKVANARWILKNCNHLLDLFA
jgi:homoserine kinase type II